MEWRKINLSQEGLKELEKAEGHVKNTRLLKRIQCIKLKNKGWKHKEVQSFLNIQLETVSIWVKNYLFLQKKIQKQ